MVHNKINKIIIKFTYKDMEKLKMFLIKYYAKQSKNGPFVVNVTIKLYMHMCVYICVCLYIYVCVYMCVCLYICVCIYI